MRCMIYPGAGQMPAQACNRQHRLAWLFSNAQPDWLLVHLALQCGNALMHESVSVHDLGKCTRPWFEWANAMLVVFAENALGLDCSAAAEKHRMAQIQVRTLHCPALNDRSSHRFAAGTSSHTARTYEGMGRSLGPGLMALGEHMLQEREAALNAQGPQWHSSHTAEDPMFFETLEASIRHTWVDKSRCASEGLCARIEPKQLLTQLLQGGDWARLSMDCTDGASQSGRVEQLLVVRETVCLTMETCSYLEQAVTLHPSSCVCRYETYAQVLATK